jgi:hypothetical protein
MQLTARFPGKNVVANYQTPKGMGQVDGEDTTACGARVTLRYNRS